MSARLAYGYVTTAPYGSWPTPFTSASVVAGAVRLGELVLDGADVLWAEGRPAEGGRTQLVRRSPDGTLHRPAPRRAERAHGRPRVRRRRVVGARRRRLVRQLGRPAALPARARRRPGAAHPGARDPAGRPLRRRRPRPGRRSIVCVRERHRGPSAAEVDNEIVRLDAHDARPSRRCWSAAPTSSRRRACRPDGGTLAWLRWNHPSMPWDATELVVRDLDTR